MAMPIHTELLPSAKVRIAAHFWAASSKLRAEFYHQSPVLSIPVAGILPFRVKKSGRGT